MGVHFPLAPLRIELRVNGYHNTLGTELPRTIRYELRIENSCCVDPDLIRACAEETFHILDTRDPTAYRERNRNLASRLTDNLDHRRTPFHRSRNIEEHKLIRAFFIINRRKLYG